MNLAEAIERYLRERRDPRGPDRQMREIRRMPGEDKSAYNRYVVQTENDA